MKKRYNNEYNIDLSKIYKVSMIKLNDNYDYMYQRRGSSEEVETSIDYDYYTGSVVISKEGYETLYIYDFYFKYLLDLGKITVIEQG